MDAVKEAVLEQKIDDLTTRFDGFEARFVQAEERNREEHGEIRAELREEIGGLRAEINEGFRSIQSALHGYNRTLIITMGSLMVAVVAALGTIVASLLS